MGEKNVYVPLSASALLGLTETRKVARVDLGPLGYPGVVYVSDLTTGQQQKLLSGPRKGRTRVYKDNSMDVDWSDLSQDAGPRILEACLVTDASGGYNLERLFEEAGFPEFILIANTELVSVADQMAVELKQRRLVLERLELMPNIVTSAVVKAMRRISGLEEDRVEEKKEP